MLIPWQRRTVGVLLSLVATVALHAAPVHANRFGPPWQARIVVDQATLYSQPDRASAPVGPLSRGQVVVVVDETTSDDGTAWTKVPDGYLASSDVDEDL